MRRAVGRSPGVAVALTPVPAPGPPRHDGLHCRRDPAVAQSGPVHAQPVVHRDVQGPGRRSRRTSPWTTPASPAPNLFDGDLHFSGRAPEIGLRARWRELINARRGQRRGRWSSGPPRRRRPSGRRGLAALAGACPRRAGAQGRPISPLENPYPDHVFEIHPVTTWSAPEPAGDVPSGGRVPGRSGRTDLRSLPSGAAHAPGRADHGHLRHPALPLQRRAFSDGDHRSPAQEVVPGGRFVTASALDTDGNLLV